MSKTIEPIDDETMEDGVYSAETGQEATNAPELGQEAIEGENGAQEAAEAVEVPEVDDVDPEAVDAETIDEDDDELEDPAADPADEDDAEPASPDVAKARAEAKKFRQRAQAAEAKVAQMGAVMLEHQTYIVHGLARRRLADVRDFDVNIGVQAVITPEGLIDEALLDAQIDALLAERPHLARPAPRYRPAMRPGLPARKQARSSEPAKVDPLTQAFGDGTSGRSWRDALDRQDPEAMNVQPKDQRHTVRVSTRNA